MTWSEQSLGLNSVLNWRVPWTGQRILEGSESLGLERLLDWRERDLYQGDSLALERQPRPRQGVLDWREWFGTGIQPSLGDRD